MGDLIEFRPRPKTDPYPRIREAVAQLIEDAKSWPDDDGDPEYRCDPVVAAAVSRLQARLYARQKAREQHGDE